MIGWYTFGFRDIKALRHLHFNEKPALNKAPQNFVFESTDFKTGVYQIVVGVLVNLHMCANSFCKTLISDTSVPVRLLATATFAW